MQRNMHGKGMNFAPKEVNLQIHFGFLVYETRREQGISPVVPQSIHFSALTDLVLPKRDY